MAKAGVRPQQKKQIRVAGDRQPKVRFRAAGGLPFGQQLTAVSALDAMPPTEPSRLFELVYETPTPQLVAQRAALQDIGD